MIHLLALVDQAEEGEGVEVGEVVEVAGAEVVMREVVAREVVGEEEGEGEVEIQVPEDIRMLRGRGGMIRRCRGWALSRPSIGAIPSYHHTNAHCPLK